MFTSSSVYSFGEIMTTLGNVPNTTYSIALISSAKSISTITAIFLARRIPSYFLSPLPLRVQSILLIDYSIGCANPSLFLNIIARIFLIRFSSDRIISLTLNFFYLKSNITFIFLRLTFTNSIFIKILFYIPVITRTFLLITLYIIFRSVFWLSYQIFAPYNIIEYTAAIQILRISLRASPYFLMILYILIITFLAFLIF